MPVAAEDTDDPTRHRAPNHRDSAVAGPIVLAIVAVVLLGQVSTWVGSDLVLPLVLVAAGMAVIWRQLDTDRTLSAPRRPLGAGRGCGPRRRWRGAAAGHHRSAGRRPRRLRRPPWSSSSASSWRPRRSGAGCSPPEPTSAPRASARRSGPPSPAHLHDSVLQTLALIQRHADEPQAVSRLARSQERELRAWLYDPAVVREGGTWAGLVAGMVAEVERPLRSIVEPVVVGDAPLDDALAGAGRGHPGGAGQRRQALRGDRRRPLRRGEPERVTVFVRDRGSGFDPATVSPTTGTGLRDSVHRPDEPPRRDGGDPLRARRRDRGGAARCPTGRQRDHDDEPTPGLPGRRPRDVPRRRAGRARATRRRGRRRGRRRRRPRSTAIRRHAARRRAARRAPARRRRAGRAGDAAHRAARRRVPGAVGLRRGRGRHRRHPGRGPRLRHQDDLADRSCRRRAPGGRRRRRLQPAAGRVRARRVRRGRRPRRAGTDPELDQLTAREREVHAAAGPRLRLQGDRPASCSSRSRRSRPTCRTCCASSRCPTATSSPAGRRPTAFSDHGRSVRTHLPSAMPWTSARRSPSRRSPLVGTAMSAAARAGRRRSRVPPLSTSRSGTCTPGSSGVILTRSKPGVPAADAVRRTRRRGSGWMIGVTSPVRSETAARGDGDGHAAGCSWRSMLPTTAAVAQPGEGCENRNNNTYDKLARVRDARGRPGAPGRRSRTSPTTTTTRSTRAPGPPAPRATRQRRLRRRPAARTPGTR